MTKITLYILKLKRKPYIIKNDHYLKIIKNKKRRNNYTI